MLERPDSHKGAEIVAGGTGRIEEQAVLRKLIATLGPLARPRVFVVRPELPTLGSGKIDFRQLTDWVRGVPCSVNS